MHKKLLLLGALVCVGLAAMLAGPVKDRLDAQVASARPLTGFGWSSNIGWVSFSSTNDHNEAVTGAQPSVPNYGVFLQPDGRLTGEAWSANLGWLKFDQAGSFPQAPAVTARLQGNQVVGWARFLSPVSGVQTGGWDGWVKLSGTTNSNPVRSYGVTKTTENGQEKLNGFAWGDLVVGWLNLDRVFIGDCVTTTAGCGNGPFTLTVRIIGDQTGTVSATNGLASCVKTSASEKVCTYSNLARNTVVALTATPSNFDGWSGECSGTAAGCSVTMTSDKTVVATYDDGGDPPCDEDDDCCTGSSCTNICTIGSGPNCRELKINIESIGTVGSVNILNANGVSIGGFSKAQSPAVVQSTTTRSYGINTTILANRQLSVVAASVNNTFRYWYGNCVGSNCSLNMNSNKTVTAHYGPTVTGPNLPTFELDYTATLNRLTISNPPQGSPCPASINSTSNAYDHCSNAAMLIVDWDNDAVTAPVKFEIEGLPTAPAAPTGSPAYGNAEGRFNSTSINTFTLNSGTTVSFRTYFPNRAVTPYNLDRSSPYASDQGVYNANRTLKIKAVSLDAAGQPIPGTATEVTIPHRYSDPRQGGF